MSAKALMSVRMFDLVVPLAHEATAMRITETAGIRPGRSGAVSPLSNRWSDVDSTIGRAQS
jgi:RNA-directed DNA polymerase